MKKAMIFFSFLAIAAIAYCQDQTQSYDSSFQAIYKEAALHPGYMNRRGIIHDSVVKRWDKDIMIYVEGGNSKDRKETIAKLKNTIALITPALGNKIRISFVNDKPLSNYVINLDYRGRSGWFLKWDGLDNIYNCRLLINKNEVFNRDQQTALVSHYFLKSLGDFVFMPNTPMVVSNMRLWRQDINNIDLQILKLHYSDDIKPGMAGKDIDKYFLSHNN